MGSRGFFISRFFATQIKRPATIRLSLPSKNPVPPMYSLRRDELIGSVTADKKMCNGKKNFRFLRVVENVPAGNLKL